MTGSTNSEFDVVQRRIIVRALRLRHLRLWRGKVRGVQFLEPLELENLRKLYHGDKRAMAELLVEQESMGASVESRRFWIMPLLRKMNVIAIVANCMFPCHGWAACWQPLHSKQAVFAFMQGRTVKWVTDLGQSKNDQQNNSPVSILGRRKSEMG